MLQNVVAAFLSDLRERDLDLPLLALLHADEFFDIHFTHGNAEFGKDFLAKRKSSDGCMEQWCFQSKAGDINQSTWRNDVQGQLLEAATSNLGHPGFDTNLPRRVALIVTGRLAGNAALAAQDFNENYVHGKLGLAKIEFWTIDVLAERFTQKTLAALGPQPDDLRRSGAFLQFHGDALQGKTTAAALETYSQTWLPRDDDTEVFKVAFEAALIAQALRQRERHYEEVHAYLALARALLAMIHDRGSDSEELVLLRDAARAGARDACSRFVASVEPAWRSSKCDLVRSELPGVAEPAHYLVYCARMVEIVSLAFFWSSEPATRVTLGKLLDEFVAAEPGAGHPLSDRHVVSLVWAALVLIATGRRECATKLIRNATVWLCDRFEDGGGLASVDADPADEIRAVFGARFEFVEQAGSRHSFCACALADLAAFLQDGQLYADVVNDLLATKIAAQYWQAADTPGQFVVEGEDVVQFMSVRFEETLPHGDGSYAEHVVTEPAQFSASKIAGPSWYIGLSLLLRDRYFVRLWQAIVAGSP
ncbi:hypothetical protein [Sandaracinus amylolyticus]|uniref:hypothetical protein n=1 Tax=Sandaracinus amylolyticus TaxID=927083 RepID=UPI001F356F97|nr:hypothetical protein [Sandaracinus amylolyticus]UJR86706.1 Hypothetical protein I5071_88070 [Sandaracinus amylolyticus]